jgi:hypothetical protein
MSTALATAALIPASQPYSGAPWNYLGTETVSPVPAGMVDWVLLELRSDLTTVVAQRAALILSDGTIVDTDGSSPVTFDGVSNGSYYLVVKHRNHLSIMSASAVALNQSSALYDFTTGFDKYHGGADGAIDVGSGVWGMVAGNADCTDQDCFPSDLANIRTGILGGAAGYLNGDTDMDGDVFPSDYAIGKVNVLGGRSSQVP